jgi:peptide-methionine (R)-S-oxide reductase
MTRRSMLTMSMFGVAGVAAWGYSRSTRAAATAALDRVPTGPPPIVSIAEYSDAGVPIGVKDLPKVVKSEAAWKAQLTAISFEVTRHADTEIAFTGATWNVHNKGLFRCVCCDTPLFSSDTKFDSGTGWPSFWAPLDKRNIVETSDSTFGMERTAVSCRRCDAHLGHVFDDGPKPTGLRYCMNSAAMRFVKLTPA